MKLTLLVTVALLFSTPCLSKTVRELSLTGNFRNSKLDDNNFQKTFSLTGSFAVYLWERSAVEFSYTQGSSNLQSLPSEGDSKVVVNSEFRLFGGDFVTTFNDRKAPIHPYIKLGLAYMDKTITREVDVGTSQLDPVSGIVPSAGLGIKIKTNERFFIKLGADLWASPIGRNQESLDYTFRFGLSCYF